MAVIEAGAFVSDDFTAVTGQTISPSFPYISPTAADGVFVFTEKRFGGGSLPPVLGQLWPRGDKT